MPADKDDDFLFGCLLLSALGIVGAVSCVLFSAYALAHVSETYLNLLSGGGRC